MPKKTKTAAATLVAAGLTTTGMVTTAPPAAAASVCGAIAVGSGSGWQNHSDVRRTELGNQYVSFRSQEPCDKIFDALAGGVGIRLNFRNPSNCANDGSRGVSQGNLFSGLGQKRAVAEGVSSNTCFNLQFSRPTTGNAIYAWWLAY